MAESVARVRLQAIVDGLEGFDQLIGAFKGLQRAIGPTDQQLTRARQDIIAFGEAGKRTEQVIQGQITALKALKTQAGTGGALYTTLGADVRRLEGELQGLTAAYTNLATGASFTAEQLRNLMPATRQPGMLAAQVREMEIDLQRFKVLSREYIQGVAEINRVTQTGARNQQNNNLFSNALNANPYLQTASFFNAPEAFERQAAAGQLPATVAAKQQEISRIKEQLQNVLRDASNLDPLLRDINRIETRLNQNNATSTGGTRTTIPGLEGAGREMDRSWEASRLQLGQLASEYDRLRRAQQEQVRVLQTELIEAEEELQRMLNGTTKEQEQATRADERRARIQEKLAQIQQDTIKAPNVGGYRDPETGAMLARGTEGAAAARANLLAQIARPPREISSLYQSIGEVGFSRITNDIERMGNSFQEVAGDIRKAKAASDGSINSLQSLRGSWSALRNTVGENSKEFREATRELERLDKQLERTQVGGLRGKVGYIAQGVGAIASAGIFGGPEGALGGALGGAVGALSGPAGFTAGAFLGSSIGAYAGMGRQQIAAFADYAAQIDKLKIALKGVTKSADEYQAALAAIEAATTKFNVARDVAISGFTKLSASVIGAGGKVRDAELVFNGVSAAIRATGGSAEDVQGALTAMAQVFSKGKATAEEIQGQLGERLPGAVTLFAEATGRTGAELAKAFEQGTVGLNDVMKFVIALGDRFQETNDKIAASSEAAGDRAKVAFAGLREEIGRTFQPLGAAIQNVTADLAEFATGSLKAMRNSSELNAALGEVQASSAASRAAEEQLRSLGSSSLSPDAGLISASDALNLFNNTAAETYDRLAATDTQLQASITRFYEAEAAVNANKKALLASGMSLDEQGKAINAAEGAMAILQGRLNTLAAQNKQNTKEAEFYRAKVAELKTVLESIKSTYKAKIEIQQIFTGTRPNRDGKTSLPEGYRVVNGRLAYQVPGVGWVDAETGRPVFGGSTANRGQSTFQNPSQGNKDETAKLREKSAESLYRAIEQREQGIADSRKQYEEQIAEIRKAALEEARGLEKQFQADRVQAERETASQLRTLAGIQQDTGFLQRIAAGENPSLVQLEQRLAEIDRTAEEKRIAARERFADAEFKQKETIAQFQQKTAENLNKANEAYAKRIGEIQRNYAINVAKIMDEASGRSAQRLVQVQRIFDLYAERNVLNTQRRGYGLDPVPYPVEARNGNPVYPAGTVDPGSTFVNIDREIQRLYGSISQAVRTMASVPAVATPAIAAPVFTAPASLSDAAAGATGAREAQLATQLEVIDADKLRQKEQERVNIVGAITRKKQELLDTMKEELMIQQTGINPQLLAEFKAYEEQYKLRKAIIEETMAEGLERNNALEAARADLEILKQRTEELYKQREAMQYMQDNRIGLGIEEGAQAYVKSIGTMREATSQLAQSGIKGVEDAIFSLVTSGTANFKEFAAEILKQTTRMIIQQLILRTIMQAIGAIGGGGGSADGATAIGAAVFNANGNVFSNGIQPFATGGIVTRPTMFRYANGGVPGTGLMGEAGPEAIIPLRRGRDGKLGVAGGGNSTSVTVNVDASGSNVQGDAGEGEALGKAISRAVQAELVKQRRPGGLLAA